MPVEDAADRASFLDVDEFGEEATYAPAAGGDPVPVNGIYDGPYEGVAVGGEVIATGSLPSFTCRTADLPAGAAQGDTLTVAAGAFRVKELQPDGSGMTVVTLTSAPPG